MKHFVLFLTVLGSIALATPPDDAGDVKIDSLEKILEESATPSLDEVERFVIDEILGGIDLRPVPFVKGTPDAQLRLVQKIADALGLRKVGSLNEHVELVWALKECDAKVEARGLTWVRLMAETARAGGDRGAIAIAEMIHRYEKRFPEEAKMEARKALSIRVSEVLGQTDGNGEKRFNQILDEITAGTDNLNRQDAGEPVGGKDGYVSNLGITSDATAEAILKHYRKDTKVASNAEAAALKRFSKKTRNNSIRELNEMKNFDKLDLEKSIRELKMGEMSKRHNAEIYFRRYDRFDINELIEKYGDKLRDIIDQKAQTR